MSPLPIKASMEINLEPSLFLKPHVYQVTQFSHLFKHRIFCNPIFLSIFTTLFYCICGQSSLLKNLSASSLIPILPAIESQYKGSHRDHPNRQILSCPSPASKFFKNLSGIDLSNLVWLMCLLGSCFRLLFLLHPLGLFLWDLDCRHENSKCPLSFKTSNLGSEQLYG